MSQKAAIRRRRQAVQGDRHVAPRQRRWAKPTPVNATKRNKS